MASAAASAEARRTKSSQASVSARAVGETPAATNASSSAAFSKPRAAMELRIVLRRWANAASVTAAVAARRSGPSAAPVSGSATLARSMRTTAEFTWGAGMKHVGGTSKRPVTRP